MADRWMDERDRRWRERDWRGSEDYGRGDRDERRFSGGEDRSWGSSMDEGRYGEGRGGSDRDRVFGERESGMSYGGEGYRSGMRSGGGAYGAGGSYGGGEGSGRDIWRGESRFGGRGSAYRGGRGGWQDRDYQGVSPAMRQGEYEAERDAERYGRSHGGGREGGRYYGDAGREPIYREEWSQGRRDYGSAPRGYDAGRGYGGGRFEEGYDSSFSSGAMTSGGTGGYDYERGYGDGGRGYGARDQGRQDWGRDHERHEDRGERFEQKGREAGQFFRRAGERVASWFGGGEHERRDERDYRGMGPKGYRRPDERISDEVHERLTEDPWVDASNINVSVSGGEVTLSGTVENREAKHRAERCVEDISGVHHVQNNLRVERGNPLTSPGRGYGDSVLEHQMRGETGAGENLSGNALAGSGSSAVGGTKGSNGEGTANRGSTSTDTGKSR